MNAAEIMDEINRLPPDEREVVRAYAAERLEPGQLSSEALTVLTQKMIDAKDPAEAKRLKEEIIKGFYGDKPHA